MYLIEIQREPDSVDVAGIDAHELERLATRALQAEDVAPPAELSIVLVDDVTIHALNREYRQVDAPTDVLSFSQREGEQFAGPDGAPTHLGDVIISIETARRQAAEREAPLQDETAHLLVHGILHLLGYDHEIAAEGEAMRAREDAVLGHAHH